MTDGSVRKNYMIVITAIILRAQLVYGALDDASLNNPCTLLTYLAESTGVLC